ncbi:MAG: HK97 gp10 family phage protein [Clostridia bacterium]|nr:HK97 gp10 family phage protein [Clostridia bacterium]
MANDLKEWEQFFLNLETKFSSYNFKNQMEVWLQAWCENFLNDIVGEIESRNIIDTGALKKSFTKGETDNIWIENDAGLTIEVGSENPYAAAVNNGHKTCPVGVAERWVPGRWSGNGFIYDRSAKTGMLIKQQWIDARPFFTAVERYASKDFAEDFSKKLDEWLDALWS